MASDKNIDNGESVGSERELPPLDKKDGDLLSKSEGKKSKAAGVKVLPNKLVVFGGMALVSAVILIILVAVNLGDEPDDGLEKGLDVGTVISDEVALSGLPPLLLGQEGSVPVISSVVVDDQAVLDDLGVADIVDVSNVIDVVDVSEMPHKQLDDVLGHLRVLDIQHEQAVEDLLRLSERIEMDRSQLLDEVKRGESDAGRIASLEKSVATLVKEVKRLKWVKRSKKTARNKSSIKVHGFFVWQYRPGVEIEHSGVFERFYEGDVLDGMRLIKIDMDLEQVVFSRKGNQVVFKLEEG